MIERIVTVVETPKRRYTKRATLPNYRTIKGERQRLCTKCRTWKLHKHPLFYLHPLARFGLATICKECSDVMSVATMRARRDAAKARA